MLYIGMTLNSNNPNHTIPPNPEPFVLQRKTSWNARNVSALITDHRDLWNFIKLCLSSFEEV